MATTVLGLKTFAASDPVDYNEVNDNYNKIDNGVKTALQGRAAQNLFDNSNFRINQLGQTSYTANGYTVDRWAIYKWSNDSSISINLSVNADGVILSGGVSTASTPSSCYLYQKIECNRFAGKTLTAAVYVDSLSGNGTGILCAYNNTTYIKGVNLKVGLNFLVFDVPSSATVLIIKIGNDASNSGRGSITASIRWAALYEGSYTADTLPDYQPKGYAAELAECQRYYRQMSYPVIPCGNNPAGTQVYGFLPFRMRIDNPTISCNNLYYFKGDTTFYTVSSASAASYGSGTRIFFNLSSNVDGNLAGAISGNGITLSADL